MLELCESEIEKQFLLIIMNAVIKDKFSPTLDTSFGGKNYGYKDWKIGDFSFVYETVESFSLDSNSKDRYLRKGYRDFGLDLYRPKSIKFKDENFMLSGGEEYTYYELTPQYEVSYQKNYRLDFAIIATHYVDDKLPKNTKVAVECDGYEFHYTRDQQKKDTLKGRELQLNDWKLYRMAGSEIYSVKTADQINDVLKELRILTK
jgi:hypothetical protein